MCVVLEDAGVDCLYNEGVALKHAHVTSRLQERGKDAGWMQEDCGD